MRRMANRRTWVWRDGRGLRGVALCAVRALGSERAQSTLEYALVLLAFLGLLAGLAALWHAGAAGVFADAIERGASHALDGLGLLDVALY